MLLMLHASKVILKILKARLQQYVNKEPAGVQARFRKSRGTRDQIANISWIIEKAKEFQKNIYFCFIDYTIDGGAWWAAVYGVAQSQTGLKGLSSSSSRELTSHKLCGVTNRQNEMK